MTTTKSQYREGQTVHTSHDIPSATGSDSDWPSEQDGTLLQYLGDGDWLVYVPGHGSPVVNEREFS